MSKLTLTTVASGYQSQTAINSNMDRIETFSDNVVTRDGTGPNYMEASLDLNSNRVINLGDPIYDTDAVTKAYVDSATGAAYAEDAQAAAVTATEQAAIATAQATATVSLPSNSLILASGSTTSRTLAARFSDDLNVEDYGAIGDGTTDDTASFQAAIDAAYTRGGGTVRFTKRHLIDGNLTVKPFVTLKGGFEQPEEDRNYSTANYDAKASTLVINSSYTISLSDGAKVKDAYVIRKGLSVPFADATAAATGVAAFAGTAFTSIGAGSAYENLMILGFNKAIYSTSKERVHCINVRGDCTNGIETNVAHDIVVIERCHFWPYLTTHQSWTTNALLKRTGTAYRFYNTTDWGHIIQSFCYGYAKGFDIESCNASVLMNCGADHVEADTETSVGFHIHGTSQRTRLIGCISASQGTGLKVDVGSGRKVIVSGGCNFVNNDVTDIDIITGRAIVTGSVFESSSPIGITIADASEGVFAVGNDFNNSDPFSFTEYSDGIKKSHIQSNYYSGGAGAEGNTGERIVINNNHQNRYFDIYEVNEPGAIYHYRKARGNMTTPATSVNGDYPWRSVFRTYDGTNWNTIAEMQAITDGTQSAGASPGKLAFATTPAASATPVNRLNIDNAGVVYPGTDNAQTLGSSTKRWSAVWAANGTIQTSDLREKSDVSDITLGIDFINSLRPVTYKWKNGGNDIVGSVITDKDGNEIKDDILPTDYELGEPITKAKTGNRTHLGLIAQEVHDALVSAGIPDCGAWILSDKNDTDSKQALRYDQFIAPLIKAVQELSKEIQDLKNK